MSGVLLIVYLARHGETAWTTWGQHTGLTDLPLTQRGERNARQLGERLRGVSFARELTSPLQRAPDHAHRFLLISFVFLSIKHLVIVHFFAIK
jgi:broad specificity phosphatase PhoE